jgi:TPR repeat protein
MSYSFNFKLLLIIAFSGNVAIAAVEKTSSPDISKPDVTDHLDQAIGGIYFDETDDDGGEVYAETEDLTEQTYQRGRMAFLFGNYEFALKMWEPLAKKGYAKAQATLGWMYHTGKGVKKNLKKATKWYFRAAKQEHVIAQNNLGVFHEQGLGGTKKNSRLAAKWYREAAEVGYAFAQYNLGKLYQQGNGVKKDIDEAIFWLQIAALQGVEQAQSELEKINKHLMVKRRKSKKLQWKKNKVNQVQKPKRKH